MTRKIDNRKKYSAINLPEELVSELKIWRKAFAVCYPTRDVTYEFMLRGMLDSLEVSDPGVKDEYDRIVTAMEREDA